MSLTRINGLACTAGTLYGLNVNLHLCTVKSYGAVAVDISAEDDAVDETVEAIVKEINPLAFLVANDTSGKIYLVTDVNVSSADLQHRIRQIGADTPAVRTSNNTFTYANTSVGPNDKDISATTVTAATGFTTA